MRVEAFAKINLSLRVEPASPSGMHPIRTMAQTIDWADMVELVTSEEDAFTVDGAGVPADGSNLAMAAVVAVREATGRSHPVDIRLQKRIPVAAGLGGGSSDAAAVLAMASKCLRLDPRARDALGPELGADVALFLTGGLVRAAGYGERVSKVPEQATFHVAVAVPPFPLSTADVYRRWDEIGGPTAPQAIGTRHLPPSLRSYGPLANDLLPAALDLAPDLGDWISDLGRQWGTPVAMSGSGPSVFGMFSSRSEADAAAAEVAGARAARGCSQTESGRREID